MKDDIKHKIIFLMGLPGSGKTYYALNNSNAKTSVVNVDDIIQSNIRYRSISHDINKVVNNQILNEVFKRINYSYETKTIIIDGPFFTNNQIKEVMNLLNEEFKKIKKHLSYKVIYWKKDIESCLFNDQFRREKSSEITIKNSELEEPDLKILGSDVEIEFKKVVKKSQEDLEFDKFMLDLTSSNEFNIKDHYLMGEDWSGGGSVGGYDGSVSTIDADPPEQFGVFNTLMRKINPDINYLDCSMLIHKTCDIVESSSSDYYGGNTTNFQHRCNLHLLFHELKLLNKANSIKQMIKSDEFVVIEGSKYRVCYIKE